MNERIDNAACERSDLVEENKQRGWPDRCGNCGAHWSRIGFDYALGFNCNACGASDADE